MEQYNNNLENLVKQRTGQLEEAQKKSEEILTELLPKTVADELKLGRTVPPKNYKMATVMYSDIVGFTSLCSESQPMEVVTLLSGLFQAFDSIIGQHQAYKVETIGDAYMVASGVPEKIEKKHVKEIAMIALKQRDFLFGYTIPHRPGQHLHCRWGFNTGPVFTGVVGITAPRYCVFGKTVTIAAKMENSGIQDKIQMTVYSQKILADCFPEFQYTKRDKQISVNGFGTYLTYWLESYEELLGSVRDLTANNNTNNNNDS
uniref:guanylate cyclase n=1 Tax=Panagrolaimus davidi TaxID=227884 RepID=A0A914PQ87_9BILA